MTKPQDVCVIVLAGGSGQRFKDPRGKQFVDLCGKPLMSWALIALARSPRVGEIVIACADDKRADIQDMVDELHLDVAVRFASGGATRQESAYNALQIVSKDFTYIAMHDSARPLVEPDMIDRCCEALAAHSQWVGVICGQPVTDTLKLTRDGMTIDKTPDRSKIWAVQTPQVFYRSELQKAHAFACETHFVGTDDASLFEHMGNACVGLLETSRDNVKVTLPEDLEYAEVLMKRSMHEGREN